MTIAIRTIESERLMLEPLVVSHAVESLDSWACEDLYRFIPAEVPSTLEALKKRYAILETRSSPSGKETWLNWLIREKSSGKLVGLIEVTIFENKSAQLAYFIFLLHQHKGYATEACLVVLEELKVEYRVREVHADIDTRNSQSIKLANRLKFRIVGTTKDADIFKGGPSDEHNFVLEL